MAGVSSAQIDDVVLIKDVRSLAGARVRSLPPSTQTTAVALLELCNYSLDAAQNAKST